MIQAAAETLRRAARDDPSAVPRFADQLEREAVRLSRIVADLLDLSRLESGSALDEVVSLGGCARGGAPAEEAADRAGVSVEVRAPDEPHVRGPSGPRAPGPNRSDNAIRYSHEGGKVTVDIEPVGADVLAAVSDRHRHPHARHPAHLRALLPRGLRAITRDRRDGARSRDREARRREPRRDDRGRERARARHDVPRGSRSPLDPEPFGQSGWSWEADGRGVGAGTIESPDRTTARKRSARPRGSHDVGTGASTSNRRPRRHRTAGGSSRGIRR